MRYSIQCTCTFFFSPPGDAIFEQNVIIYDCEQCMGQNALS